MKICMIEDNDLKPYEERAMGCDGCDYYEEPTEDISLLKYLIRNLNYGYM